MGSGASSMRAPRRGTEHSVPADKITPVNLEDISLQEEEEDEEEAEEEQEEGSEHNDAVNGTTSAFKTSGIEFGKTQTGSTMTSEGVRYDSPLPSEDFIHLESYNSWGSDIDDDDTTESFTPRLPPRQCHFQKAMVMEEYLRKVNEIGREVVMRKFSRSEWIRALRQSTPSLQQQRCNIEY